MKYRPMRPLTERISVSSNCFSSEKRIVICLSTGLLAEILKDE